MKALRLRREFRLHHMGHEIDTENRTDDSERIRNRISDRRIFVVHHLKCGLKRGGARHRSGVNAHRMTNLDSKQMTKPKRDKETRDTAYQRKQIVRSADALHSLEELAPVEDTDAVKEHDQAGQADRPDDLRLRSKCAEGQTDEQHRPYAERKPADIDLANEVT